MCLRLHLVYTFTIEFDVKINYYLHARGYLLLRTLRQVPSCKFERANLEQ